MIYGIKLKHFMIRRLKWKQKIRRNDVLNLFFILRLLFFKDSFTYSIIWLFYVTSQVIKHKRAIYMFFFSFSTLNWSDKIYTPLKIANSFIQTINNRFFLCVKKMNFLFIRMHNNTISFWNNRRRKKNKKRERKTI